MYVKRDTIPPTTATTSKTAQTEAKKDERFRYLLKRHQQLQEARKPIQKILDRRKAMEKLDSLLKEDAKSMMPKF